MINRPPILALFIAAAVLLPAAAQAHWNNWCGCQGAPLYPHHRYYAPHERNSAAVQLAPNVFAIPYRLRNYPYVSGGMVAIGAAAGGYSSAGEAAQQRVIDADAQVTILGPDRMDIRLFRKGRGVVIHSDH